MGVAAARRAVFHEALGQMLANAPGALRGANAEYLHQMRVGMRRLRAAMFVFEGTLQAADARALRLALRRLARVAGAARDWDVFTRRLPPALRLAAQRHRRSAQAGLRAVLREPLPWVPPRGLPLPPIPLAQFARAALERADRRARRRGERIDWVRPRRRHALRIQLRRLRYAGEFLCGAFPTQDAAPLILSLKHLQDLLGELNDLQVARRLRKELDARPPREGLRKAGLIKQLPAAWRAFLAAPRFWLDK
ncbi:MAG: CHAD domain-containing protein [Burkholderiales bacterium]